MRHLVGIILGILFLSAGSVSAQHNPFENSPEYQLQKSPQRDRTSIARKLIRMKNYQGAADLLELELAENDRDMTVVNLLKTCYGYLKQYDKAVLLLRKALEINPKSVGHRLSLAEFLTRAGKTDSALAQYHILADATPPEDLNRNLLLIRSFLNVGLDSAALAHIDRTRMATGDATAFGVERGTILEGRLQYSDAAREYLSLLKSDSSRAAAQAEKKLLELLEFQESSNQIESLLMSYVDSTSGIRTLMLLTDYYTKTQHYDEAFELALNCDSMTGYSGYPLVDFLRQCRERKAWDQLARMGSYIQGRSIDPSLKQESEFAYAEALVHLDRTAEAVAAYDRLVASATHPQVIADALFGIGVIYLDYKNDCHLALEYFDSIATHYPHGLAFLNARRAIPHCHLQAGELASAAQGFATLTKGNLPEDYREEAAYYLGLIEFFRKDYDSTALYMNRLMVDFPKGFFYNDALTLSILMTEVEGNTELLDDFSEAWFFEQQGLLDSTRSRLQRAVADSANTLADVALYELAELELKQADSAAAIETASRLIEEFPESYYLPMGMKLKADLYFQDAHRQEQAAEIYRQLLETYPDYPFTNEVREKLRELQTTLTVG